MILIIFMRQKEVLKLNLLKKIIQVMYKIYGIENRIEQIIANLLDNSNSFSSDNQKILLNLIMG